MTDNEVNNARKKYYFLLSLEQELKKLKKTKEELEENAIIKEYLSLCKK